jgi:hypothetical protein
VAFLSKPRKPGKARADGQGDLKAEGGRMQKEFLSCFFWPRIRTDDTDFLARRERVEPGVEEQRFLAVGRKLLSDLYTLGDLRSHAAAQGQEGQRVALGRVSASFFSPCAGERTSQVQWRNND